MRLVSAINEKPKIFFVSASLLLSLATAFGFAAGYQWFGESRDYENYIYYFSWVGIADFSEVIAYRFEPGFALSSFLLAKANLTAPFIYSILAGAALAIKFLSINEKKFYIRTFCLFLVFYGLRYFVLFEMTLLRATLAMSLAFFVFMRKKTKDFRIVDFILLSLGVSFYIYLSLYSSK